MPRVIVRKVLVVAPAVKAAAASADWTAICVTCRACPLPSRDCPSQVPRPANLPSMDRTTAIRPGLDSHCVQESDCEVFEVCSLADRARRGHDARWVGAGFVAGIVRM